MSEMSGFDLQDRLSVPIMATCANPSSRRLCWMRSSGQSRVERSAGPTVAMASGRGKGIA